MKLQKANWFIGVELFELKCTISMLNNKYQIGSISFDTKTLE